MIKPVDKALPGNGGGPDPRQRDDVELNRALQRLHVQFLEEVRVRAQLLLRGRPNITELRNWGHRLRGTGGSFGFKALSVLGRELEELPTAVEQGVVHSLLKRILDRVRALESSPPEE